jgi:hypothetical protein
MTPMQRSACFAVKGLRFGGAHWSRQFAGRMARAAEHKHWPEIALTQKQILALSRVVLRFRRQINNPHVQFWAQRTLAEAAWPGEAAQKLDPSP